MSWERRMQWCLLVTEEKYKQPHASTMLVGSTIIHCWCIHDIAVQQYPQVVAENVHFFSFPWFFFTTFFWTCGVKDEDSRYISYDTAALCTAVLLYQKKRQLHTRWCAREEVHSMRSEAVQWTPHFSSSHCCWCPPPPVLRSTWYTRVPWITHASLPFAAASIGAVSLGQGNEPWMT